MKIGSLEEMLGGSVSSVEIIASLQDESLHKLKNFTSKIVKQENRYLLLLDSEDKVPEALDIIRKEKGIVHSISPVKKSLEEFFMEEIQQANKK